MKELDTVSIKTVDDLLEDKALLIEIYRRAKTPNMSVVGKLLLDCTDEEVLEDIRVSRLLADALDTLDE